MSPGNGSIFLVPGVVEQVHLPKSEKAKPQSIEIKVS